MKKVISVVGARPQFIKEAIIGSIVRKSKAWNHVVIHSGQHYDSNMSDIFYQNFQMPAPDYSLTIGSGTHGAMTARALLAIEEILLAEVPDALLVYGDTNTTLAGALAAAKLKIPIIHVEAGIRMNPKSMPEEINRVLTDKLAHVMCCCSQLGKENLAKEGIFDKVYVTGDVMFDLFQRMSKFFCPTSVREKYEITTNYFVLVTIHRDYNVDCELSLTNILESLLAIKSAYGLQIVFPMHPRTKKMIRTYKLEHLVNDIKILEPLGYIDLMSLVQACSFVVTDSGGLQKEAYYARKRSIVIMPDTGWREVIDIKWNILSTMHKKRILEASQEIQLDKEYSNYMYGDGSSTEKIIEAVLENI